MNTAFAAFYGEYEEPFPIGIFDTLEKAKQAVEISNSYYDTEVKEYNLITGNVINVWIWEYTSWERIYNETTRQSSRPRAWRKADKC